MCKGLEDWGKSLKNEGLEEGLAAIVRTLKPICKTFEELYKTVVSNEEYKSCKEEQVRKYY